jgi:hypothetical protein
MQRVLDLDLDFFVHGVAHFRRSDSPRLDGEEFPPWEMREAIGFLEDNCLLTKPLPGFAVENHREHFAKWRTAIDAGVLKPPFHVTHVDAHADLGLGEYGYAYLMTSLLYEDPADRAYPVEGDDHLDDGSFLAFAIACRWLSDLTYVFGEGGGDDVLFLFREGFDPKAERLQLSAMAKRELERVTGVTGRRGEGVVDRREPAIPFREVKWPSFQSEKPFDFVCLARSPAFTPPASDTIFDAIRSQFVNENSWPK